MAPPVFAKDFLGSTLPSEVPSGFQMHHGLIWDAYASSTVAQKLHNAGIVNFRDASVWGAPLPNDRAVAAAAGVNRHAGNHYQVARWQEKYIDDLDLIYGGRINQMSQDELKLVAGKFLGLRNFSVAALYDPNITLGLTQRDDLVDRDLRASYDAVTSAKLENNAYFKLGLTGRSLDVNPGAENLLDATNSQISIEERRGYFESVGQKLDEAFEGIDFSKPDQVIRQTEFVSFRGGDGEILEVRHVSTKQANGNIVKTLRGFSFAGTAAGAFLIYNMLGDVAEASNGDRQNLGDLVAAADRLGLVLDKSAVKQIFIDIAAESAVSAVPVVGQVYRAIELFQSIIDAPELYYGVKRYMELVASQTHGSAVGVKYAVLVETLDRLESGDLWVVIDGVEHVTVDGEVYSIQELEEAAEEHSLAKYIGDGMMTPDKIEYCFAPETLIVMSDGAREKISEVRVGDDVSTWGADGQRETGKFVARRVTAVHVTTAKHLLDFHGTRVTPGHVFLRGDGQFQPLLEIIRADSAVVDAEGRPLRACTNFPVGSAEDQLIDILWIRDQSDQEMKPARLRAGTWLPKGTEGEAETLLAMLVRSGYRVLADGKVQAPNGTVGPLHWFGEPPKPYDYLLRRSGYTSIEELYDDPASWEGRDPLKPASALI